MGFVILLLIFFAYFQLKSSDDTNSAKANSPAKNQKQKRTNYDFEKNVKCKVCDLKFLAWCNLDELQQPYPYKKDFYLLSKMTCPYCSTQNIVVCNKKGQILIYNEEWGDYKHNNGLKIKKIQELIKENEKIIKKLTKKLNLLDENSINIDGEEYEKIMSQYFAIENLKEQEEKNIEDLEYKIAELEEEYNEKEWNLEIEIETLRENGKRENWGY
jgi:hypothetical protein